MSILDGRVAIVTGGGGGIGERYCRGLAAEGAQVVVADILEDGAHRVATEIGGLACHVDVSDERSVQALFAATMQAYGRIDALINNAAVFAQLVQPRKNFDDIPLDDIRWAGRLCPLRDQQGRGVGHGAGAGARAWRLRGPRQRDHAGAYVK